MRFYLLLYSFFFQKILKRFLPQEKEKLAKHSSQFHNHNTPYMYLIIILLPFIIIMVYGVKKPPKNIIMIVW